MTRPTAEERRKMIAEAVCHPIGCSGVGQKCPGDIHCSIVRKVILASVAEKGRKS